NQPQSIVSRNGNKTRRDLDHIESEPFAFGNIFTNGIAALDEHTLDEPAGGYKHIMLVTKLDEISHCLRRHKCKRAAGKLQGVDIRAHCFEQIFEIASAHD